MKVKAFAFDVDGVFSSSQVYMMDDGEPVRTMNIKDGYAVQFAVKKKYPIAIITGGSSEAVKKRFQQLGVTDIYLKSYDKMGDFDDFLYKYDLDASEVLYMGDDIPDYNVMKKCGVPVCPSDASEEIKSISKYISNIRGGEGCARDVIEQVLRAHGCWMDKDSFIW